MSLPNPEDYGSWSEWKQFHKIDTPTFNLTSVEKPDLSPFLIHMTGKDSLVHILKGGNAPDGTIIRKNEGYLKAVIPDYEGKAYYNSKVVCFTESPLFALDFFRYRSSRRFIDNQQFGIGFSKADLILKRGVRPVIYFDTETNKEVLKLCNKFLDGNYSILNSKGEIEDFRHIFAKIKPLLFPLLEKQNMQGFMWEREWRYPDEEGLVFSHKDIKVICCPSNEKSAIRAVLGDLIREIQIVESWREYDEVTTYLRRRQKKVNSEDLKKIESINDIEELKKIKGYCEQTLNALKSYYGLFRETTKLLEENDISSIIKNLEQTSQQVNEQIKAIEERRKENDRTTRTKY